MQVGNCKKPYIMVFAVYTLLLVAVVGCQSNPPPSGTATSPASFDAKISNLKADAADTVIHLSWQPLAGSRGYFVFRDGATTPLNSTAVADPRFDDIGLTNGRTYTYTVAAVGQGGQIGPRSALLQAIPKSH